MLSERETPELYGVRSSDRKPLIRFMLDALTSSGCRIIQEPRSDRAPFRFTFETPEGERMGVCAYAFFANSKVTKNRPSDEHRFQIKYGSKNGGPHEIWIDPSGLYVTLFLGINPTEGFFVAADPVLHNPTKFFISLEFKQRDVEQVLARGWHCWERDRRNEEESLEPVEVLVGGTASSFIRLVRFERDCLGEDQGHRQLLAERDPSEIWTPTGPIDLSTARHDRIHELAREFELADHEVLDLIASARRLKMAVRGWVAETHLVRALEKTEGVTHCRRIDDEGGPDVELRYRGSRIITVECKNALRNTLKDGTIRVDFQRTRASKSDPCSRFYSPQDFDVVAACTHAVTQHWDFRLAPSVDLDVHTRCPGKLSQNVRLDTRWASSIPDVLNRFI